MTWRELVWRDQYRIRKSYTVQCGD